MLLFHLQEEKYLICLRKRYTWEYFRRQVKVSPGTYSENFAKGLYSSVFEYKFDLVQEYRKYYSDEYKDIYQFMFWRYGISEEIYLQIPDAKNLYLVVFESAWQLDDDDLLKETFIEIFRKVDE